MATAPDPDAHLEVMDERLHAFLHRRARRGDKLVVVDFNGTRRDFVQALADDTQALAHLLHAAQIAVVAIAVGAHGNVELDLGVLVVWLRLAKVPRDAAPPQHHAAEAVVERLLGGDEANADGALLPDAVARNDLLDLVDAAPKLRRPHEDVIEQPVREVEGDAARAHVCGMQPRARDALVELHELFALLEAPEEGREPAHVHDVRQNGHEI